MGLKGVCYFIFISFCFCMHRDDDRSLYLVKTVSAFEGLHSKSFDNFLLEKKVKLLIKLQTNVQWDCFSIRVFSTCAISHSCFFTLSFEFVACMSYRPSCLSAMSYCLKNSRTISASAVTVFQCFSVDGHIFVSLCYVYSSDLFVTRTILQLRQTNDDRKRILESQRILKKFLFR